MSRASGLSPADKNRLGWACKPIRDAFDAYPYLVGSALDSGDYRDIDIRLILDDDDFRSMFGGRGDGMARLRLVNTALSALIQQASGMSKPIDFQIQPQSYANDEHSKPRNPLGMSGNKGGYDAPDWSASPTPTGPEPAKCEHKHTEAHDLWVDHEYWDNGHGQSEHAPYCKCTTRRCPGPATPTEPTEETPTDWSHRCGECRSATICDAQRRCVGPGGADPKETPDA